MTSPSGVNGPSGGGDLTLVSAASLGRGGFAIDLPLTGPSGVEVRSTLPNKKLKITMTVDDAITSVGGVAGHLWRRAEEHQC